MANNICRACLSEKKLEDLCDWYLTLVDLNESLTYQECFQLCTQLDVKKADSVSSYVRDIHFLCKDCVQELLNSYRFMKKSQKSARELYYLSQKDENPCDIKANEFEWVNIQTLCKSEESTDTSRTAEHTIFEDIIKDAEEISTLSTSRNSEKIKLPKNDVEVSRNPLLPPIGKSSKKQYNNVQLSVPDTDTQGMENTKLETAFDCDSVVKEEMVEDIEDEDSVPITETVCCQEAKEPVVHENILKKVESKSNLKVKSSTIQKMRSKSKKVRSSGAEYKQTACEYCKKLFPENKLKQHQSRYHRPKVFLCDICPSAFSIANNLRRHQRTHDLNRERNFTCDECGRKFFTEDVYRTHIKIHQSTRQPQFKCTQCDKVFMHKGSLTLHLQKHTGPKNECSICKKRYVRKIDLEVHMRNHSGDLPYQCSKCGKSFMTTSALRKHELLHSGIRYKCEICNKEYSHPSKLSRHRLDHTGLPLKCAMCNKGFAEPNKIRRHIGSVHKVDDIVQINNLIIRVSKNDSSSTKDSNFS